MSAMLGNSAAVVVVVVVVRTRTRAIPLVIRTTRKFIHAFPFLSYMSMGLHLAALWAAKRSPILIWERKGVDFLMVIMASGIARGRVRTTTTTTKATAELPNMVAILQLIGRQRHAPSVGSG